MVVREKAELAPKIVYVDASPAFSLSAERLIDRSATSTSRLRRREELARQPASMCKHILNAQVSIRAPCCKQWFDCAECHAEKTDHELMKVYEMVFACKKCKKVFRKDYRYT